MSPRPIRRRTSIMSWARVTNTRLRTTGWSIGQCAVGAVLAWWIATSVLDHPRPFFAPVAVVVCLGVSSSYRLRRMGELAIGVTIGVGIADLLIREIGNGWWQIGLVVVLAMGAAQLFGGGALLTTQSAVQAIFLTALPQTPDGGLYRWEDALIGGGCALLVAAALPGDPCQTVQPQAQLLLAELASVISEAADAIREGRPELADEALERARGTQSDVERWTEALRSADEISRISPLRRHLREDLIRYREALVGVDRAARNMRVAIRRIGAVLDRGERMPLALAGILDELAEVLHTLKQEVGKDPALGEALPALAELAARLDPELLGAETISANLVVAQVRSAVVDLLGATGVDLIHARALLPADPPVDSR